MYSCQLDICFIGLSEEARTTLGALEPLPSFSHDLIFCDGPHDAAIPQADAIFARYGALEGKAGLEALVQAKAPRADLIVIASPDSWDDVSAFEDELTDFWEEPLAESLLVFRFSRWQQRRKDLADQWQTAQYLDATIDSIPSLVWYKTRDGVHEKVNESFCRTVRKTKEQVQGQRHAYIWDVEQDDPACIESENEVMSSKKTCISEESVQTGEGMRLLTTYKSPLYDLDGSVMGTVGVGIDITQERAYEQSLLERNSTLETIFTSLDCGVLTHSMDGSHILGVNRTALDILGYESEEDLMDQGFSMIAPSVVEEDRSRLIEMISQLKNVGDSASTQYQVERPDGAHLHVMGNMKLIERGGQRYIQRFLLDITDQKHREEVYEQRQRSLMQALAADYLIVCSFNLDTGDGELLRIAIEEDKGLADIFQGAVSLERTVSQYIDFRVLEEDREMLREALSARNIEAELEQKKRFDKLYRAEKSGVARYRQATVVSVSRSDEGHVVVIGFRNVDQQIREELEQKALLEEALGYANRANEAKSAFLLNMSHDIRTPMNAIVGFTTLATSHTDEPQRVEEYLGKIKTSSNHLLNLINDILDMSRIEQGKVTLEEERCNLRDLFADLHDMLQNEAAAKRLRFTVDASAIEHDEVICDRLKVNQIVLNLLGNALKFTHEGGSVEALLQELPASAPNHASYCITVEDTGIGMSQDFLQHIFDPFERERTQTISGIQGSGLGMAIVKNLVDMMGGTVEVESEAGKGSVFRVYLTFALPVGKSEEETPVTGACAFAFDPTSSYRILLVDDNALNREIASELLEDAGFSVECAVDGRDALDQLQAAEPDYFSLVLMDIQMPVMNGYEAAMAIRSLEDEQLASIPILAVTADAFDEDRNRALDCGMNGHLAKPIDVAKLLHIIGELLSPQR